MAKRKKKNQIRLICLLLVLVLLSGFYVWYLNKDRFASKGIGEGIDSSIDNSLIIATMDPELIERIYFRNDKADMTLVLEDDIWVSEADKRRPIKQNYVQNMINLVDEVKADRLVSENPEDIEQYGLNSPYAYIEATQSDGKSIALTIGSNVPGGQGYYARIEGNGAVYVLASVYGSHLSYSDINMTQVEHGPTITPNDIYHIEILQKDREDFELIYDPDSLYHIAGTPFLSWAVLKPYEEVYSADSSKVSELLSNYSSFRFVNCVEYMTDDFAKYGLDDPNASIFLEYYEQYSEELEKPEIDPDTGEEITSKTVTEEKNFKLLVGNLDDNGDYYVRKDGDSAIYTMKAVDVDDMLAIDTFSILSNFINIYDINTIEKIDINIEGKPYTMDIKRETIINDEDEEEIIETYYYNGEITEESVFKDVYQTMIGAKLDVRLNEEASVSDLEPVLTLTYHISGSEQPYKTSYYPYDDSFYLVDSGYPIRFAADKRKIDEIIKAIEEFKLVEE